MSESLSAASVIPLDFAKEHMVFNADVAHPVVLSNKGELYHPERLVPNALYSIHHQNKPLTLSYFSSVEIRSVANLF